MESIPFSLISLPLLLFPSPPLLPLFLLPRQKHETPSLTLPFSLRFIIAFTVIVIWVMLEVRWGRRGGREGGVEWCLCERVRGVKKIT